MKRQYNYWLISGLCWFVYVTAYFGRINLSIAIPRLHEAFGYSNASLGMIASCFFTAYASGQLINGFIGDIINPRYFVSLGLFSAGLCNVLFGFSQEILFLCIFWSLNGYAQSMLWGPLVRMVSESTPQKHIQKVTLFFASSTIFGYLFSYTLVGKMVLNVSWRMAFIIPGVILMAASVIWFFVLWNYRAGDAGCRKARPGGDGLKGILDFLLRTKLWAVGLIALLNGGLKEGLTLWGPSFFVEYQALSLENALRFMSFVPLMNIAGLLCSSLLNRAFKYQIKYTIIFFLLLTLAFSALLKAGMGINYLIMNIAFFGFLALLLAVNNMLTSFMPLYFKNEGRVSTTAGFLDCSVYIGAAISGPLSGFLADKSGWHGIIDGWIWVCVAALGVSFLSRGERNKHDGRLRE
jgi:OPA family glycerol-3-phosphate transporter-like MFS transporter